MSALVKKLVVVAGVEGLILHPPTQRNNQRNLQIKYKTLEISPLPTFKLADSLSSTEVHGIIGD